ncbi:MAG: hypothetical protein ACRDHF_11600 [Tepidiformaceae bacterium]
MSLPVAGSDDEPPDDLPFGKMREKDRVQLIDLAKARGVDIYVEMEKAYKGDEQALTRVLGLSSIFTSMDRVTKVYGNLVFASFINLGEDQGVDWFAGAMMALPPDSRQRALDFLYYAVTKVPKRHRAEIEKEVREGYASMFPSDYVFGQGNPLFD